MNRKRLSRAWLLVLFVGWGCSSGPGDPHSTTQTPDEFGRELFAVLKDQDHASIDRYLWHEQDWAFMAEMSGKSAPPAEELQKMTERIKRKLHEGITDYHERYFKPGSVGYGGEPIRSVEYVRFETGRAHQTAPEFTSYNDSYLVVNINGSGEQRLEIDHIQVIKGVWHLSEIR